MEMSKGMQAMVRSIIGMLGLKPEIIEAQIAGIGKSLYDIAANSARVVKQNDTIARQNQAIMTHLGIADIIKPDQENFNGREQIGKPGDGGSGRGPH